MAIDLNANGAIDDADIHMGDFYKFNKDVIDAVSN